MKTTFEKSDRSGHPMVPSQSAALTSMCGTTLASIDRHRSLRSTEATPLHVSLWPMYQCYGSTTPHPDCVNHISCLGYPGRLACVGRFTLLSVAHLLAWSLSGPCKEFLEKFGQVQFLMVPCISARVSACLV